MWTITHDGLNLKIQGPPTPLQPACPPSMGPHCTGRPVQTCSPEEHSPTSADIWWLLNHVGFGSERYASYWNAFLFDNVMCDQVLP